MRAISIYTALAAVVSLAGASGAPSGYGMDARYSCYANCGNCTRITHDFEDLQALPCNDLDWNRNFAECTTCVLTHQDIWKHYNATITGAATACNRATELPQFPVTSTVSTTASPSSTPLSPEANQCYIDCAKVIRRSRTGTGHCERSGWINRYRMCNACSARYNLDPGFRGSVQRSSSNCTEAQLAPPTTGPAQTAAAVVRRDVNTGRETFPAVARRQEEDDEFDDEFWDVTEEEVQREELARQEEAKLTEDEGEGEGEGEEDDNASEPQPGTPRYKCHEDCGGVIQRTREQGCEDEKLKGHREGCKKCALKFNIWLWYARGVKAAMTTCGLPEFVPDPKEATSSATAASQREKQSEVQPLSARPPSEVMPLAAGKQPDNEPQVEGDYPEVNLLSARPSENLSPMVGDYPKTGPPESKEPEKQSEKQQISTETQSDAMPLAAGNRPETNRLETEQSEKQQPSAGTQSKAMPLAAGKPSGASRPETEQSENQSQVAGNSPKSNQTATSQSEGQSQAAGGQANTKQPVKPHQAAEDCLETKKPAAKQPVKPSQAAEDCLETKKPATSQSEGQPPAAGKQSDTKQSKELPQAAGMQSDTNLSKELPQAKESGTKPSDKQPQIKDQEAHQSGTQSGTKESGTMASAKQSKSMASITATTTLALKPPASASSGSGGSGNVPQPISSAKVVQVNGAGKILDFATAIAVAALAILAVY